MWLTRWRGFAEYGCLKTQFGEPGCADTTLRIGSWIRLSKGCETHYYGSEFFNRDQWLQSSPHAKIITIWSMWSRIQIRRCQHSTTLYRPDAPLDMLADGIRTSWCSKMSIALWRLRWNRLPSFSRMRRWGMSTLDRCLLCNDKEETTGHLFLTCNYNKFVWNTFSSQIDHAL